MEDEQRVVVTEVRIPFPALVVLMLKLAVAAIPALLLLSVLGWLGNSLIAGFRLANQSAVPSVIEEAVPPRLVDDGSADAALSMCNSSGGSTDDCMETKGFAWDQGRSKWLRRVR